jgi:hypothetical protein
MTCPFFQRGTPGRLPNNPIIFLPALLFFRSPSAQRPSCARAAHAAYACRFLSFTHKAFKAKNPSHAMDFSHA